MEIVEESTERGLSPVLKKQKIMKGQTPTPEEEQMAAASHCDIYRLPEDMVSGVLSLTSPGDALRFSAVSSILRLVADSDAVWERFLPPDYPSILSRAVEPVDCASKKDLFLRLCDRPVLLDGGKMSFALDRESGAKCYMLSARAIVIIWSNAPQYWKWIPLSNSRFSEGAELLAVCWLHIFGNIESKLLSPKTTYGAYLIFNVSDVTYGLEDPAQEALVALGANVSKIMLDVIYGLEDPAQEALVALRVNASKSMVCLRPNAPATGRQPNMHGMPLPFGPEEARDDVMVPQPRSDGWMEIEMGAFYNGSGVDGEVYMSLRETNKLHWKKGLIVQGIEVRPKKLQGCRP